VCVCDANQAGASLDRSQERVRLGQCRDALPTSELATLDAYL